MSDTEAKEPKVTQGDASMLTEEQKNEIIDMQGRSTSTCRPTVAKLEQRMYEPISVFNKGFVRVVDYMGDDVAIVQAARVSYGRGTKKLSDDRSLIRYLMRHQHSSPLEMAELKLHIKLPIFVARQMIRHRTANVNEYSARYSEVPDEFYVPQEEEVNLQGTQNKQGGDEIADQQVAGEFIEAVGRICAASYEDYQKFLKMGVSRELARIVLPVDYYTQWYWKCDLRNIFNFLRLRLDLHAQHHIRIIAEAMASVVKDWVPLAWEAFDEYVLNAITFSKTELSLLNAILQNGVVGLDNSGLGKREWEEFCSKVDRVKASLLTVPVLDNLSLKLTPSKRE